MNSLKTILLTLFLAVAFTAAGQGYVIDSVCRGAERHYRIDGEAGSTYTWTLTNALGTVGVLNETADTATISWNISAGDYILSALQTSIYGCDSLELGTIKVFEAPIAYAGENSSWCKNSRVSLSDATASGYRNLSWKSSGDGSFDNTLSLNPEYTFGPADIALGSVTLTLTATGLGRDGSCPPAESSLTITLSNTLIPAFSAFETLCMNSPSPVLPDTSANSIHGKWNPSTINTSIAGTSNYTFTPDSGQCSSTVSVKITVTRPAVPAFEPMGPFCRNSIPPALPAISPEGVSGKWEPATINTSLDTTLIYTFTPDAGQCALPATLAVEISNPEITGISTFTSTNGLANGYVIITARGTAPSMAYSINGMDWQTQNVFSKLTAGTYTAWVRNQNGCMASQQFIILNKVTGEVEVLAGNVESCISIPFEIPLMAYDFTNISAFSIQLAFDSSILTFNGLSQVNSLLNQGILSATLISPGILQMNFQASDSITLLSEDLLFKLSFYGLSPGLTELKWNWLNCVIYSASGYEIPAIYSMGLVEITPVPQIFTSGGGEYCPGTPITLGAGSLNAENLSYKWTSPDGQTHAGAEWELGKIGPDASGEYQVTATGSKACSKTETLDLYVFPSPEVHIGDHDTLCSDHEVVLAPGTGFATYSWQDGSTAPQLVATAEGLYWVIVTDHHGCQGSDSVLLRPCELLIWMPNAFSPNGDGLNDEFLPKYNHDIDFSFKMLIFNKWGEQLFSSSDKTKGWDGTFKGMPCPPDLYTWVVSFNAPVSYNFNQKSPAQGTVMLLK